MMTHWAKKRIFRISRISKPTALGVGAVFGVFGGILAPPAAHAGVWVQTSALAWTATSDEPAGPSNSSSQFLSSSTVGYSFLQGFVIGAQVLTNHSTATGDFLWSVGPKGGLLIKGFEVTAAFLPTATDTGALYTRKGSGFAINVGYSAAVYGPLRLGLYGIYWSTSYNQVNGATLTTNEHESHLSPLVSLGVDF